ncbi:histidine phosphatase family protein [Streptomyces zingiberis]|uniref:histidine phosphatase family protein n=1 Tax=Streptomyces zingiberis TaxID=2053010 RepID=UPI002892EA54|nr:histidine phosphatase family protein [Streptomyces zingiberis]
MTATRTLYLARHGEATPDETTLTEAGDRQAAALGRRLREARLSVVHHGPLPRAERTARLVAGHLDGTPLHRSEAAGDYLPHLPRREELPPAFADSALRRLDAYPAEDRRRGPALAREALARFTGPVDAAEPRRELVVTHAFLIGWLVRAALDAPPWRWMGLHPAHAALTVIRYAPGRPASVLALNDMAHLSPELRWTGFPDELRY